MCLPLFPLGFWDIMQQDCGKQMSSKEIRRLSRNVYDSLHSSTFLFDLPRVVEELVHNSVDAGSTKVVVSLSVRSCYVKVDDDGCGVSRDGLVILGENNVIVRDLFYNQPIRRKSMQSSLRKVLHSVKKYVFRIALAHPHVSFNVIEIEGEQKLLCTIPSLSSLPLVTDGFGNEVSSSLREIVFSDGELSLSGYISGPIGAFSTKVFQYIYINARFISKGPIHNLINSLAASFQSATGKLRDASENHCRKRQKTQEYPAYLLNLCCPLSSYVLSFEPSKTVVEFKDWGNVLSFFELAIIPRWEQFASNLFQGRTASCEVFFQESGSRREGSVFHKEVSNPLDTFSGDASNYQKLNRLCDDKADCVSFSKTCHSKDDFVEVSNSFCQHEGHTFQGKTYMQKVDDLYECPLACDSDGKVLTLMENERFNSACCSTSYGFDEHHDFLKEPISEKEECTTDENLYNNFLYRSDNLIFKRNIRKSFLHDRSNSQPPVIGVIRKCQKWPQQVKSSFEISTFFRDDACSEETSLSHRKVAEYVDDADSKFGLSHFGFIDSWIARTPPRRDDITSDSAFIENHLNMQGVNYKNYVIGEMNAEFSDTVLSESHEVLPDLNFTGSTAAALSHKSQSDFLLHQFRTPKGASSSKETGCLLFESSSVRDADIYSTSLHNFAMQNSHDEAVESPTQNKEFQNSLFSHVHELRLRRSYSAPPFYKGKKKFPILNCLPTDNARENSKMESSHCIDAPDCSSGFNRQLEPYSASQPCMKPITEPKQACLREINYEKSNRSNKVEMQTCEEFDNGSVADEIVPASVSLTKWRTCSLQPAFNHDCVMPHKIDVLDISSGLLHLAGSSLVPASIHKGCLDNVRVLLQLDRKFIPVVASGILLIIDQHAADERIRLEELRKKVLHGELRNSTYLNPELELVLPELGYQLLQKYAEQIKKWGWICNIHSLCSESFTWSTNFLRQQKCRATLVAVPHILGTDLTGKDLLEYIEQLVETDGSSMIPPAVLRILNYKACRGAIMFGDALLPSECSLIVEELKATSLCFQCAHGRPTTVPLLNISALHEQLSRLDISMAERCSDLWHGLRHHTPSIKRACQRLESCKRFLH